MPLHRAWGNVVKAVKVAVRIVLVQVRIVPAKDVTDSVRLLLAQVAISSACLVRVVPVAFRSQIPR